MYNDMDNLVKVQYIVFKCTTVPGGIWIYVNLKLYRGSNPFIGNCYMQTVVE